MGRIKTSLIKRITHELIEKHKNAFTSDFNHNKIAVSQLTTGTSPKLRNIIAGYATRLTRKGSSE